MLKRIAIIGPESTGKSTLAADLAKELNTVLVPEYAREYIDKLNRPYEYEDLLLIAKGQVNIEDDLAKTANRFLIVDTTLTVMRVWSEHKYNRCDPWIIREEQNRWYDLLLVCDIDLPWEEDPQREHPHLREHFFGIYKEYADTHPPCQLISGERPTRLDTALRAIGRLEAGSEYSE